MALDNELALRVSRVGICYRQRQGMFRSREFWALDDVCLDLRKGEALGLVGRNGAGKSSLLRVLAGIIHADRGQVETFGHSVALLGLLVGFNQHLSGRDNAVMNAMLQGVEREVIESKLHEVEAFAGLGGFFDQPVRTYSAGMRTRLRFAIAIQVNPDILLVDEVLGVGDAPFSKKSAKVIRERIQSEQTVLVVSHSTGTLKSLCDRVAWIEDGKTRMIGKTTEVLDCYEQAVMS